MATIDPLKVQSLLGTSKDVTTFIETAQLILEESLSGQGMSDARLTQIGQYLAAHYASITLTRGQITQEEIDDAREERPDDFFSEGLNSTLYGQQAIQLDTSGQLASMSKRNKKLKPILRVV